MRISAKSIRLHGKVQQVGFRYYVYRLASELGIKGFVKNMPDNSVYVEAESDPITLDVFIEHCKKGSPHSTVQKCKVHEIPSRNFNDFRIQ